ncbi:hypothetical protein [Flavobacterium subsaxonicum]|uniref:Response regulatory domain-containing protein n=1 Tax=Flavobacterium subsaxonicum WB 4.1-42 = DSM 21790 TaxID=1121898 RepID=A0A0A2MHD8_9FLAO|nr:hypothetical protein [Flavobacterium subsaxonicum]KGO91669.1 hypothetical protein Q766_16690 [Flavobacterium subsaxonicum WB 4.1-42 = DSM 21790]
MSKKINILYIGRHAEILETVVRLINKNDSWNGIGVSKDSQAMELFIKHPFDIVLLGCGIDEEDENKLRTFFTLNNPSVKIVQHYGGGSGLLYNEITTALTGGTTTNFLS